MAIANGFARWRGRVNSQPKQFAMLRKYSGPLRGLNFGIAKTDFPQERSTRGFTIVELLVVIAITVVLVAILIPILGRARSYSNFARCKTNIHTQLQALTAYSIDNGNVRPALFRYVPPGAPRVDWVSPDIKWSGTPVGMGILVQNKYLMLDTLMDPSEGMTEDVARDVQGWNSMVILSRSGSSYAYCAGSPPPRRSPTDPPLIKYGGQKSAVIMDLNAEVGHNYVGEYSGRAWVNHPALKRMNVGFTDGAVLDYGIDELQLKYPAGSVEELQWFAAATQERQ